MPRPSRNPNGRPKGSVNKRSLKVAELLEKLNCSPIEGLARIAMCDIPCTECLGKGKARYAWNGSDLVRRPEQGQDQICLRCYGSKKEPVDVAIRAKCHSELAGYVYAKLRSVEHTGPDGGVPRLEIVVRRSNA